MNVQYDSEFHQVDRIFAGNLDNELETQMKNEPNGYHKMDNFPFS